MISGVLRIKNLPVSGEAKQHHEQEIVKIRFPIESRCLIGVFYFCLREDPRFLAIG